MKTMTEKRMTIKRLRKWLDMQMELSKVELDNSQYGLPSLDTLKRVEQARARLQFGKEMLEFMDAGKK